MFKIRRSSIPLRFKPKLKLTAGTLHAVGYGNGLYNETIQHAILFTQEKTLTMVNVYYPGDSGTNVLIERDIFIRDKKALT